MAKSNAALVGEALEALRDGLQPIIEHQLAGVFGRNWVQRANDQLYNPDRDPSADDLAFLLKATEANWNNAFRDRFGKIERSLVSILREYRNDWAHNKKLSATDTNRVLDAAEQLLELISAVDQQEVVARLKRDHQAQVAGDRARHARKAGAVKPTAQEPRAGLAPWREVIAPHPDVAKGTFEQAEFAADLYRVSLGEADPEYGDPQAFFARTYLTDGISQLIVNAARRWSEGVGDPVIELQTNFGGGKTHSLIALYHLASDVSVSDLPGVDELLGEHDLTIPDNINRAVFVGQKMSVSGMPPKPDGTVVNTLWGELAWQLGGADGYAIVADDDRNGTNPGDKFTELLRRFGPSLILIDEWVAYARDLPMSADAERLPAGDFDTQFTFAQALTEAAASVPNALVLVSIPASDIETGGERGQEALRRLKQVNARVAAQWRPASTDESFEIVRRRLFQPLTDESLSKRDEVLGAFSGMYYDHPKEFPTETKEKDYLRRMEAAYPIHPELFDRLYSDWSTVDRFQRTRGMLRLMAAVISELWKRDDRSLLIMPGTLPVDAPPVAAELTKYLEEKWEPIISSDVDGPNSLPLRLDQQNPNLGRYSATRRVARTTYLGSAPRAGDRKGVEGRQITLGCVQPGEQPGVFADALRYLSGEATYLYQQGSQYWYDTKPSLNRLAGDRATGQGDDFVDLDLRRRITATAGRGPFGGVHVFPDGPGDVPDDDHGVRLVILSPDQAHSGKTTDTPAIQATAGILDQRQGGPRINRNLLVFLAPDAARVGELRDAVRQWLAWKSIWEERGEEGLNLAPNEAAQARTKMDDLDSTVQSRIAETFQIVLTPSQEPGSKDVTWQTTRATGDGSLAERVAHRLSSAERLITAYGGIRVRMDMDKVPLWDEDLDHQTLVQLWSYYCRYPYLPRLASREVLNAAVSDGVARTDWSETFAYAEAWIEEDGRYRGLRTGEHVHPGHSTTAVIIKPERAAEQVEDDPAPPVHPPGGPGGEPPEPPKPGQPTRFYGRRELDPIRAVRDLGTIIEEVVDHLGGDVKLTLEITATGDGWDERVQRVVKENAAQLGFEGVEFED